MTADVSRFSTDIDSKTKVFKTVTVPIAFGEPPVTHVPGPGDDVVKIGTLELISAVAFDVGVFLLVCGALVTVVHHLARLVEEGGR